MDLSRQEYPALLRGLQPNQAVAVLEDRVRAIGKINNDIADFLSERRKVEEAYVAGLRKLAGKNVLDGSSELGIFQTPWQSIISSTEALSQSHQSLAQKIEADVERPLREYQTKTREMQNMSTIQGNLASVAREVDLARKRADKVQSGRTSANKVANASSDVEHAVQLWDSQAPYVFEQLQALDESRVNHLRDVLTQLQTHEVDQVERNRVSAESCLNAILNVNTTDEISTFVARRSGSAPTMSPRPKSRAASNKTLQAPYRAGSSDDRASVATDASSGAVRARSGSASGPATQESPRRSTGFGGLKRLGTVIGRKKDKKPERPPSPEKRMRSNLNPLRRGTSSKNMQMIPSPDASTVNLPPASPRQEPPLPKTVVTAAQDTPRSPIEQRRINDEVNGDTISPAPRRSSSLPTANGVASNREIAQSEDIPPVPPPPRPAEEKRDNEGYTVPPTASDEISRVQQEAAGSFDPDAPQFKLDIRDEPIREEGDVQSVMSNVANTLRLQQGVTPRKPSSNRGRRDVRNTVFIPTPQAPEAAALGDPPIPIPSPFAPRSAPLSTETLSASDARSIRSSHSLSSLMPVGIRHPEMTQPGLNASVIETVSAWFSEGKVTRAVVIGELALAHHAGDNLQSSGSESIRLENFPVLEKVAPNPSFITQAASRSGEYNVSLSHIPRTTVAFKYQVHLEESTLTSHAPVTLAPSWKIEPTQTSVILHYSFNPSFASPTGRSVSLKNVAVLINIENAKAQSCGSKPAGTFYKEKSMMVWRLGDITLDGYAAGPQKLLARFSTDSEAKPGNVEMRWEISGEHAEGLGSGLSLSQSSREEGGSDPFADEGTVSASTGAWKEVPVTRKIVSGKYMAS